MAYVAYRVLKPFQWNGWRYAPAGECNCPCRQHPASGCVGQAGMGCAACKGGTCGCNACDVAREQYGGDIWFAREGDERSLEWALGRRYVARDNSGLPPASEMLNKAEFKRLLEPPRALVGAKRG